MVITDRSGTSHTCHSSETHRKHVVNYVIQTYLLKINDYRDKISVNCWWFFFLCDIDLLIVETINWRTKKSEIYSIFMKQEKIKYSWSLYICPFFNWNDAILWDRYIHRFPRTTENFDYFYKSFKKKDHYPLANKKVFCLESRRPVTRSSATRNLALVSSTAQSTSTQQSTVAAR